LTRQCRNLETPSKDGGRGDHSEDLPDKSAEWTGLAHFTAFLMPANIGSDEVELLREQGKRDMRCKPVRNTPKKKSRKIPASGSMPPSTLSEKSQNRQQIWRFGCSVPRWSCHPGVIDCGDV